MSWAVGYDFHWRRDIGYGVPAICDHPQCNEEIDRGLAFVCKDEEPRGGDGCGLYFCGKHLGVNGCSRCRNGKPPFEPKADTLRWLAHKLTDASWREWRRENREEVLRMVERFL